MASNNPINIIRSLVQLAVKTGINFREIGGAETELITEASNLNGVLGRLLQEASKPQSAFDRAGAPCRESLTTLSGSCTVALDKINSFLSAFETLNHFEKEIVGTQEFTPSRLSPGQVAAFRSIAGHFKSQLMHHSRELSALLVTASADALGGVPEELNNNLGCDISTCLNELTAHLIAVGQTHLASVGSAEDENILLEALRSALASRDFSLVLVNRFTTLILAYIRALEKSSGCGDVVDTLTDMERRANQANQRYSSQAPNNRYTARSISSQYPQAVSRSVASNEDLIRFLEETQGPSDVNDPRDTIRGIYRTLCTDCEPRYKSLLVQELSLPVKDEYFEKKLLALIDEIEKQILIKLDSVSPIGQDLRSIRKAITVKVQQMLDDLEAIKDR